MSDTHTPGPWYVGHDLVNPITRDNTLSVGNAGFTVAAVVNDADARLIAAAPELLTALQTVAALYGFEPAEPYGVMVLAAIAKAEGREK